MGRWETRRSGISTSAPAASSCRTSHGSIRPSPAARSAAPRRCSTLSSVCEAQAAPATSWAWCPQEGCTRTRTTPRRWPTSSPRRTCRRLCTFSPTVVTRRLKPPPATCNGWRRRCRLRLPSRQSAAATTRWTATTAGTASARPTRPSSTRTAPASPMRRRRSRMHMRTKSPTSSSFRQSSATIAACRTATDCSASTSAPTACARFWARFSIPRSRPSRAGASPNSWARPGWPNTARS